MISDTVIVALVSTSGTFLLGVVALLTNWRIFHSLDKRLDSLERRLESFEHRMELIEQDIKEVAQNLQRLKDRLDLK